MSMAVTIKTVAERAGVSPAVVSRVLHNKAKSIRVSEATSERVRQAAKDLNYRVNTAARGLRERQTMTIGILHGYGFGRQRFDGGPGYFASLMDGIVEGAFDEGYSVTLCPKLLGTNPADALGDGRFDGLIWYSTNPSEENEQLIRNLNVPIVLAHASAEDFGGRFASIICDNKQGIELAVDHLVSLGHKKIGFGFVAVEQFIEGTTRRDCFINRMKELGMPVTEDDLIDVGWFGEGISAYLDGGLKHTAFVCVNDYAASIILRAAPERDIEIPKDLSIVGFDSTQYCALVKPSLTSVAQPIFKIGQMASTLLIECIRGKHESAPHLVVPCGLDIRETTASPP